MLADDRISRLLDALSGGLSQEKLESLGSEFNSLAQDRAEAYLPSKKIAIAVAVTFAPEAFDSQGNYKNSSDTVFRSIGTYLAPDDAPPPVPGKG